MVVSGNLSAKKKELKQLCKSGRQDPKTIGRIEELERELDNPGNFSNKRNKKKKTII